MGTNSRCKDHWPWGIQRTVRLNHSEFGLKGNQERWGSGQGPEQVAMSRQEVSAVGNYWSILIKGTDDPVYMLIK